MHETSLVEFALNAVEKKAEAMGIAQIKTIHITVGAMRGAIPMLMQKAFEIMIQKRPMFTGAALEIDETAVTLRCEKCGRCFECLEFHNIACPECGAAEYEILRGNELRIDYFEGEE